MPLKDSENLGPDGVGEIPAFPKDWYTSRTTIEEAEAENMVTDKRLGSEPVPFGHRNEDWQAFLAQMIEGDELWEYMTSGWFSLAGEWGFVLVRKGQIIGEFLWAIS